VLAAALPREEDRRVRERLHALLESVLDFEGYYVASAERLSRPTTTAGIWEETAKVKRVLAALDDPSVERRIEATLLQLAENILPESLPQTDGDGGPALAAPLSALLPSPALAAEAAIGTFLNEEKHRTLFPRLWQQLEWNLLTASGINPEKPSSKQIIYPTKAKPRDQGVPELIREYLAGTPLQGYFESLVPFSLPLSSRFEHTHVVGGSGHGKTQLLQSLILRDIEKLVEGKGSIVVIDSQGDMIKTILGLSELSTLSERIVLIDPNDIEYPPCLNLFDFGLDRLSRYSAVEREKLINGAIALYEYMFGALLGADLTQRQGVIFRYLARLMMVVPGATIHTLREFMERPEAARAHLHKLDPVSRIFFETQFFSRVYDDTRQQILTRLWGVISNSVLARMFSHAQNKVDLFSAINRGSLVLINTAKDLLKQDGCEILGRFFIALLAQATQERAAIPENRRRATFVYIDEAQDYFDEGIENLLNQSRKYKVGLVLAHQNLGQFEPRLQAAVMASTAIKLAGGVSAKDAASLAREMRCEPELLLGMRKHPVHTEFACFVRSVTPQPVALSVPFGQMEGRPQASEEALAALRAANRARYALPIVPEEGFATADRQVADAKTVAEELGEPEVL
jgi:Type IV secretion-system coupling protein DNA-binding domain